MAMRIALIGIVGQELERDFWGTLRRVAEVGYQGIEVGEGTLARAAQPAGEIKDRLEEIGLAPVAFHTTKHAFSQGPQSGEAILETVQALACPILVLSWGPCDSRQQLLDDAKLYNHIGLRCRDAGIRLTYHNHDHEFRKFDGECGLDILLENADPELLGAHIDVAWATFGGVDPAAVVRKYAGRCPVLHIKDLVGLEPGCETAGGDRKAARFTEVGTGIVDVPGVVAAAEESGVQWLTVEQDRPRDLPPMESIQVSYENLSVLLP